METPSKTPVAPLNFLEKSRVVVACGVAALLLWTIGWRVAEPADPHAALTLAPQWGRVLAVWPTLLVLTLVAAAVGTVIVGRRLPEAGMLAAAVGLVAVSLCGGSMQVLLTYRGSIEAAGRRALMRSLALDCILWTITMFAAWVVVEAVRKWLWEPERVKPPAAPPPPAAPAKGKRAAAPEAAAEAKARPGWPAFVACTVVGVLVIWTTIGRTPVATIARGQVIASVCGGMLVGALAARYFTAITDLRWYLLAAPAAALIGYLLGYINADMGWAQGGPWQPYTYLVTTPAHDLVRPLPIEYIGVGVAGILLGYWWAGHLVEETGDQDAA